MTRGRRNKVVSTETLPKQIPTDEQLIQQIRTVGLIKAAERMQELLDFCKTQQLQEIRARRGE